MKEKNNQKKNSNKAKKREIIKNSYECEKYAQRLARKLKSAHAEEGTAKILSSRGGNAQIGKPMKKDLMKMGRNRTNH